METHLHSPASNAELHMKRLTDGSRIGDMFISTRSTSPASDQVSWGMILRPSAGGGAYPQSYKALITLQNILEGAKPGHKATLHQSQIGKAIITDCDGTGSLLIMEGKSDSWSLQTYNALSGFGIPISLQKTELSGDTNRGFATLLWAMQSEQKIALKRFEYVLNEEEDTKALIDHDTATAQKWQRLNDMQQQLQQLTNTKSL